MFLSAGARPGRGVGGRGTGAFRAGTTIGAFQQATAPLGWTRVTTNDDAAIRIVGSAVPGVGGTNGFSTVNAQTGTGTGSTGTGTTGTGTTGTGTSGATTISIATMPAHTHPYQTGRSPGCAGFFTDPGAVGTAQTTYNTGSNGSGGSHTHTVPSLTVPSLTVPSLSIPSLPVTFGIKYVDVIVARKN
jgi:hypothetical protein